MDLTPDSFNRPAGLFSFKHLLFQRIVVKILDLKARTKEIKKESKKKKE